MWKWLLIHALILMLIYLDSLLVKEVPDIIFKIISFSKKPGGCSTNVSWAFQNILSKFMYCGYRTSYENFKPKLCMCAQGHALVTHTKFQIEILTINVISGTAYFRKIIFESSWNVGETNPRGPLTNMF